MKNHKNCENYKCYENYENQCYVLPLKSYPNTTPLF